MLSYVEYMTKMDELPTLFTWDQINTLHKNENCNNKRELAAAETKKKRLDANAETENDNTKCLIVKKIESLFEAIKWRDSMRYKQMVNANSVSFGSYKKIVNISDMATRLQVEDMIVVALRHNCHPFSRNPLSYTGLNEDIIDDIIEFCKFGDVKHKYVEDLYLCEAEGNFLTGILQTIRPKTESERDLLQHIFSKLVNARRYDGWY